MKKSLITVLACASFALAQPTPTSDNGAKYILNQNITFGGNNFLTLASGVDTLSDPIVSEISSIRPGTFLGIEYKAISVDSNNSSFSLYIQSRTCANAVTSVGCPTQWMLPRFRYFQNGLHFADTLDVGLIPQDTTQFGHYTLIPTGNQWRIRVRSTGTSSRRFSFLKLVGF